MPADTKSFTGPVGAGCAALWTNAMDLDDLERYALIGIAIVLGIAVTVWQHTRSE